jgi:2-haloacid dehalogenase
MMLRFIIITAFLLRALRAAQIMLAAVHPWDTHGAKSAGLQTAYINRHGEEYPPYFLPPDADVPSFVALAELLQQQQ